MNCLADHMLLFKSVEKGDSMRSKEANNFFILIIIFLYKAEILLRQTDRVEEVNLLTDSTDEMS